MPKLNRFSLEKVTLSVLDCSILKTLIKEKIELNQKNFTKKTKATVGAVSKSIKRLKNFGLIYEIKDSINFYGINPARKDELKKFITGYKLGKNRPLVLSGHAFVYASELNDLPEYLMHKLEEDKSFLSFCPKGWRGAFSKKLLDGSFKLQKTNSGTKLFAYFRTFGFNPSIIEMINNEKFLNLKEFLENKYHGLKIGSLKMLAKCPWQEYALLKDHIAVKGIALGIKHKKIEKSYNYPEWEEKGHNAKEKIEKIIYLREKELKEI